MTNVEFRYATHHTGADGAGLGGIFDIDSNTVRQGFRFTAPHGFTMPASDVHMLVQCGHYEGATQVQDDEALNEVRVI